MDIRPSDIPRLTSCPRCRREPSAPTSWSAPPRRRRRVVGLVPGIALRVSFINLNSTFVSKPPPTKTTKNDLARTYEAQSSLHSALNHALGSSKGNWLIPALHVICRNTHRTAALADEYVNRSTGNRNDHKRLQNAVTLLQASYSKTLNDRVELRVSNRACYALHIHIAFSLYSNAVPFSPMNHSVKKDQRRLECFILSTNCLACISS